MVGRGTVADGGSDSEERSMNEHDPSERFGAASRPHRLRFFEQTIAVLASAGDTGGIVGVVEVSGPSGAVPPLHVHHREDEAFYVLDGQYSVHVGDGVTEASPGTWVWGPRDVPHGYQVNSRRGRHLSLVMPGGFEAFFEEVAALAPLAADPRSAMSRVATIAGRYGVELLGPPPTPKRHGR
jgi:quercetin dioxygenase-like cupin family protein